MFIRNLFVALAALTTVLLLTLGGWQVADSLAKVKAVEWLQKSSALASSTQKTNAELAVERGLGSHLLERLDPENEYLWQRVQHQQLLVNRQIQQLQQQLDGLVSLAPEHPVEQYQQRLEKLLATLYVRRADLAASVQGEVPALSSALWRKDLSQLIEDIQGLAGVSLLPLQNNIYSYTSQPVINDVLFTVSEFLGRERAVLVAVLSRQTPLNAEEQEQLQSYYHIYQQASVRARAVIEQLPQALTLQGDFQQFEQEMQDYNILREDILHSSNSQQSYRVLPEEWFNQASRTIEAVYRISASVEQEMGRNIAELKNNAKWASYMVLLVVVLLAIAVLLGIYLLQIRILSPLLGLVRATQNITLGNLTDTVVPRFNDEIGTLAKALEQMRQQLYSDQQQQRLQSEELRKLYTAIDHSVAAILITDNQGIVEYANSYFEKITGYSPAELYGKKAGFWRTGETSVSAYQDMWSTIQSGNVWVGELLNNRKNGELYWAMVSISPVCDEQGNITHFIDFHLDISEHKRVAERLNFVSHYNQITNLPNRQLLLHRYGDARAVGRNAQPPMAVVAIRVGRLKNINDSYGWMVGDQVLREVSLRLKARIGVQDILSHQDGGKFTVLLHNVSSTEEAVSKSEPFLSDLCQWIHVQQHQLQIMPKLGIALRTNQQESLEQLLKNADLALHCAEKENESLRVYSNDIDIGAQQHMALENALHKAIKEQQLELYYQPKVSVVDRKIFAVEALVRWQAPQTGQRISPAVFIPMAEANGLIHELGEWVLNEACWQLAQWQKQGISELVMAVNVSVEQLKNKKFSVQVERVLNKYNLSPDLLEIEITESLFLESPGQAQQALKALKNIGVKLALDDFGTGYSSLSYLSWLPVDTLKIDKSFIHNITSDLRAAAVATSVIALGHRMGLRVIAEGVETQAQFRYLEQHQCDEVQGYYFSRPVPATEIEELLTESQQLRVSN